MAVESAGKINIAVNGGRLVTGSIAICWEPSRKIMWPVGTELEKPVIVAVKVTGVPSAAGFKLEIIVVVVDTGIKYPLSVKITAGLATPDRDAVMLVLPSVVVVVTRPVEVIVATLV